MPNPVKINPNLPPTIPPKPSTPIKSGSNLVLKLLILAALVAVAGGLFLILKQFNIFPFSQIPALTPAATKNILYHGNYDPSARDIYYQTVDVKTLIPYSGVGVIKFPKEDNISEFDPNRTHYIVGSFESWEDIPGSSDKYLILKDKMKAGGLGTPLEIPKVRVKFTTPQEATSAASLNTELFVEDLNAVIPKTIDPNKRAPQYFIGFVGDLPEEQLNTLIKKDDAIVVKVYLNGDTKKDLVDSSNNLIASVLMIRRFDPKVQLKKELGSQFDLK